MKVKKSRETNRKHFSKIKESFLKSSMESRIVCLIVHGSSLYYEIEKDSEKDIDLELVLETPKKSDYLVLKEILKNIDVKVECQLRYLDEIVSEDGLIRVTFYKIFMFFAYSNGYCLIGRNIYKKLVKKISDEKIKQSLLISAQIGFKDIRKSFFSETSPYNVNKNIIRTLACICMYEGFLDYRGIGEPIFFNQERVAFADIIIEKYKNDLGPREIKEFCQFIKFYQEGKLSPDFFPVINRIVSIFEKRVF